MKLFYLELDITEYGKEFCVMAESRDEALQSILVCLKEKSQGTYYFEQIESIEKGELPEGYTLTEHEQGVVIITEIS